MRDSIPDLGDVSLVIDGLTGEAHPVEDTVSASTQGNNRFIAPLPVLWWSQVTKLPKSAIVVALAIFYMKGLTKSNKFRLEPARCRELSITDTIKKRGLAQLELAGLIKVCRGASGKPPGRAPIVEILG